MTGQDRDLVFLLVEFDRGARPLEVVAHRDLMLRLHHGIVHLGVVYLTDDVERV